MVRQLSFLGSMMAAMLLLAGCAESAFRADVTRFHQMPLPGTAQAGTEAGTETGTEAGQGLLIEPLDPEKGGLQFAAYASLVGRHLGALGYLPAKDTPPDIIARIDYSITEQAGVRDDSGARVGIGIGGGGGHLGGSIGTSFRLGGGPRPVYLSRLVVVLVASEGGQRLFEGRAEHLGKNPDLSAVMPMLAEALFQGFPGVSGRTEQIRVPRKK